MDAIWVHTDRQIIKSKAQESPTAEGQCMGGRRAQSLGHNCPRTEVMRTAAVQGGSPDTLTCPRGFRHTLYLQCKSFPYTHMHSALPLQHKDTLLCQLSRTTAPCMALLPPCPSASTRAGLLFLLFSSFNQMVEYLLPASARKDGAQRPPKLGNLGAPIPSSASTAPSGIWKIFYSPKVSLPGTSVKYFITVGK